MKWFKHYSTAKFDPKIRRVISKFGIEGYGLYFAVLESISFQLETDDPIPDLEEDAQDMAECFHMDTMRVEEIIKYCLEIELFSRSKETGRLVCLKLLSHLDNTMSSNPEIRNILSNFKKLEVASNPLKQIRLDKTRLDKNKIRHLQHVFLTEDEYEKLQHDYGKAVTEDFISRLDDYICSKGRRYKSHYSTIKAWLRRENIKPNPPEKKKYDCPECKRTLRKMDDGTYGCHECKQFYELKGNRLTKQEPEIPGFGNNNSPEKGEEEDR